jgi:hypothetical protein
VSHDERPVPAGSTTLGHAGLLPFVGCLLAVALLTLGLLQLG